MLPWEEDLWPLARLCSLQRRVGASSMFQGADLAHEYAVRHRSRRHGYQTRTTPGIQLASMNLGDRITKDSNILIEAVKETPRQSCP